MVDILSAPGEGDEGAADEIDETDGTMVEVELTMVACLFITSNCFSRKVCSSSAITGGGGNICYQKRE